MKNCIYCYGHRCKATKNCQRYIEKLDYIDQKIFIVTPGKDETCKYFILKS